MEEVSARIKALRQNVFAPNEALDELDRSIASGHIDPTEAAKRLIRIEHSVSGNPFAMSAKQMENEWDDLLRVTSDSENRWQRLASYQFYTGLVSLPMIVAAILLSLFFGWAALPGAGAIAGVLVAVLAAVSAHAYFVLRIHQQARLAAERLAEKRVGILFLRMAISRQSSPQMTHLIEAGTSMFLGHHAATAIPLQADDFRATKSVLPAKKIDES